MPQVRVNGALKPLQKRLVSPADTIEALTLLAKPAEFEAFKRDFELDFGLSVPGVSRLRCNAAYEQGVVSLSIRLLPLQVPTIDEPELPHICKELVTKPRGLIIVSGPTCSGKSTTLAAMIQHLNTNEAKRIVTIEDLSSMYSNPPIV